MTYKISNWDIIYENNRTREVKVMKWIPVPVKLAGDGYTELVCKDPTGGLFGAWCALLQVAATCDPRGTLLRSTGLPHTASTISRITRIRQPTIEKMLDFCTNNLQWLENTDSGLETPISQEGARSTHKTAPTIQDSTVQDITIQDKKIALKYTKISEDEYIKLIERFGKEDANTRIERLELYIGSKGDKYKSHYMTILAWHKKEKDKENGNDDKYNF